jgi:hypothetical protein
VLQRRPQIGKQLAQIEVVISGDQFLIMISSYQPASGASAKGAHITDAAMPVSSLSNDVLLSVMLLSALCRAPSAHSGHSHCANPIAIALVLDFAFRMFPLSAGGHTSLRR